MAYSAPSSRSTSDLITAAIWNADVVANPIAIYAGAMSVTSQAIGDILYASSTTQFARVAAVATGQVLASAGTGTVPAYSATPALTSVDMGGTTVYGSRAITVDNVISIGKSGNRWTTVYATNATINTSDEREKRDIVDSSLGLDFVNSLRPVSYRWRSSDVDDVQYFGLIAQDVDKVAPPEAGFVSKENPDLLGLRYTEFIAPMIKAIQELNARIQALETAASE
jgi:hypothetical protein